MKKSFTLFAVVLSLFLVSGCAEKPYSEINDRFYDELVNLSMQSFNIEAVTKGDNDSSLEENINSIINQVMVQFSSFVFPNCEGTGRYDYLDVSDAINIDAFDLVDILGTEAFSDVLYYTLFGEKEYSIEEIYRNNLLLPNEKVAAVLAGCFVLSEGRETKAQCRSAYEARMKTCSRLNVVRICVSVAAGFVNPILGGVCAVATAIDNDTCTGNAMSDFMSCMGIE